MKATTTRFLSSLRLIPSIATAAALAIGGAACSAFVAERPEYAVTQEYDSFELRQYGTELVAETVVQTADQSDATTQGFRLLAGYIFGDNTAVDGNGPQKVAMTSPVEARPAEARSQKIAMTAPVEARPLASVDAADGWVVTFILPSELTLDSAPRPNDPRVVLRERPGQLMAVHKFPGRMDDVLYAAKKDRLLKAVEAAGYRAIGPVTAAQYDHPAVMSNFRHNEVMVPVTR